MFSKGILVLAVLCLISPLLSAQEMGRGLKVDSSPPGAEVRLEGPVILNGITPVTFLQDIEGRFRVRVTRYGYETYKSSIYLQPQREMSLTVKLKPKTRFKAAARSLFIPGWGQSYTDQKGKGRIFNLLAIGSVLSYLIADSDFDDKLDHYDNILDQYNGAETYEEKSRLYTELGTARSDAYDAENVRRITIGATIAVWGLNLLDMLFFFPEETASISLTGIQVTPDLAHGGGQIILTRAF